MAGGFTLSGGEPLMQHRFAAKLFAAAKGMGIHTALDTNGYYGDRLTDDELDTIDLVLLDIKAWDPEHHKQLTGMDVGADARVRTPARRAQAADVGALRPRARACRTISTRSRRSPASLRVSGNVQRVDVLPFHQMGKHKWAQLGMSYPLADVEPPSADTRRGGLHRVSRRRPEGSVTGGRGGCSYPATKGR